MEGGHWHVVRALMGAHQSDMLGPYFLPAVAQQGRLADLDQLVALLRELGCSSDEYVASQISSAMVSAALGGHLDMLLALERLRAEHAEGKLLGAGPGGGGGEEEDDYADEAEAPRAGGGGKGSGGNKGGGGGGDKSEL
jgi:hypothetical protein